MVLAGTASHAMFAVVLSRSIYLSMLVRRFSPLQSARQAPNNSMWLECGRM